MSHASRKRRARRSKGGAGRIIAIVFAAIVVGVIATGAGGAAYVSNIADSVDLDELARKDPGAPSVVFAADGTKLGYLQGDILRTPVASKSMSPYVRNATVAVEDKRFYQHGGVDLEGIFRAATKNLSSGGTVEGASTLEMQLIRNLYTEDRDQSYKRKIREAKLADQLEKRHPGRSGKDWVLTQYLNTAPYGNDTSGRVIKGVQAAARVYFETSAKDLTIAQAALIAGLPQAPTEYNPYLHPQAALTRRNDVLQRLAAQRYITPAQALAAQRDPIGVKKGDYYSEFREGGWLNYVRAALIKRYGKKRVAQGGLKIYTTLDLKKQQAARQAIKNHPFGTGGPSSAVVSLDPDTGDIVTAASSSTFQQSKFDLSLQGKRQPGSTFKIMVLNAALQAGINPNSTSYPAPSSVSCRPIYGACQVRNFAGEGGGGSMNLVTATLKSVNTVFFVLDEDVGPKNVTKAAREMGITSYLGSVPAEGIGGLRDGVTPLEMARAYASLANGGKKVVPRAITKVVFPDGRVAHPQPVRKTQTYSKGVASEITRILEKDIQSGTASAADYGCPAAGKTGTTDGPSDVWLAGYTPRLATATWVGYPATRKTIPGGNVQGATYAAPIWKDFMKAASGSFCGKFDDLVPFEGSKSRSDLPGAKGSSGDTTTNPDGTTSDGTSTDDTDTSGGDGSSVPDGTSFNGAAYEGGSVPKGAADGGGDGSDGASTRTSSKPSGAYETPPGQTIPR